MYLTPKVLLLQGVSRLSLYRDSTTRSSAISALSVRKSQSFSYESLRLTLPTNPERGSLQLNDTPLLIQPLKEIVLIIYTLVWGYPTPARIGFWANSNLPIMLNPTICIRILFYETSPSRTYLP